MDRAVQVTYFVLRIVAGLLFIQTGGLILFGWFDGIPGQPGTPPLISQTGIGWGTLPDELCTLDSISIAVMNAS
jgi:hypothetical protein